MAYFSNASHFIVHGSQFNDVTVNNTVSKLQFLYDHTALGASYDSSDQDALPKCEENTRVLLLSDIHDWIATPYKENGIMFLHGPAGSGKSCIARSACRNAVSNMLLGASFFFRRGTPDRGTVKKFIPTLAYQLALSNERLAEIIYEEVAKNPHVTDMGLEDQFDRLILNPCVAAANGGRLNIRAIIIDGLDECVDNQAQLKILHLMARAVRNKQFPLGIFITSRPELHTKEALINPEIVSEIQEISLTNVPDTRQDIRTVLQSEFTRILNDPRFKYSLEKVPRPWPSFNTIETLVRRSSNQFIYISTVLRFISSPDHNPAWRLERVMGLAEGNKISPFEELDHLYHAILSTVRDSERTMNVLRYILAIQYLEDHETVSLNDWFMSISWEIKNAMTFNYKRLLLLVENLLGLPRGEAYLALSQLHSLISMDIGHDSVSQHSELVFHHASFQDFLFDKSRSHDFFLDLDIAQADLANSCLKFLSRRRYDTEEEHVCWFYSAFMWHIHFSASNMEIDIKVLEFPLQRLLFGPTYQLNKTCMSDEFWRLYFRSHVPLEHLKKIIEYLKSNDTMSMYDTYYLVLYIWGIIAKTQRNFDYNYFRETFIFPIIIQFLHSFENDFLIKHLLMITILFCTLPPIKENRGFDSRFKIIGFARRYLKGVHIDSAQAETFGLYSLNHCIKMLLEFSFSLRRSSSGNFVVHSWMFGDEPLTIDPVKWDTLVTLISDRQYSGPFHCTVNDWEQMFVKAVQFLRGDIRWWMDKINHLKPMPTLRLLDALNFTAQHYGNSVYACKKLSHSSEKCLISWLKEIDPRPQELIVTWRRVFQKVRHLTMSKVDGYSYFCNPSDVCSYCNSYQAENQWTSCSECVSQYQMTLNEASSNDEYSDDEEAHSFVWPDWSNGME